MSAAVLDVPPKPASAVLVVHLAQLRIVAAETMDVRNSGLIAALMAVSFQLADQPPR